MNSVKYLLFYMELFCDIFGSVLECNELTHISWSSLIPRQDHASLSTPQLQGCQPVRNFRILYGFYMQNTGVRIWPRKYGNWALSVLSLKVLLPEQSLPVLGSKSVRICGILCLRTFKYLFNHQNIQSSLFHRSTCSSSMLSCLTSCSCSTGSIHLSFHWEWMGPTRVNRKLSFESGEEQIKGYGKVTQNTEIFSTKYGNNILEVGSPATLQGVMQEWACIVTPLVV